MNTHNTAQALNGLACEDLKEIHIDLDDWLSYKPHCLGGRATAVVGASNPENATQAELAFIIACSDISRKNEGIAIGEPRREIKEDNEEKQLSRHLPDVLMYGDILMQIATKGYRPQRVSVSKKLAPLTSLVGAKFVKAWLEVVKSHALLWSFNIEHGDPSLWNVMYNEELECGVLGDYDLSISRRHPRVPSMGIIPFMALDLLGEEYWDGKIERLYRHELEAFIWILPFVFLRYKDGKAYRGTPVEPWMTSNYVACYGNKNTFWKPTMMLQWERHCLHDFKDFWFLAEHLLLWCRDLVNDTGRAKLRRAGKGMDTASIGDDSSVASLWPLFVKQLRPAASQFLAHIDFMDELIDDLELERPFRV